MTKLGIIVCSILVASTIGTQAQPFDPFANCSLKCRVGRVFVDPSRCPPDEIQRIEKCRAHAQAEQQAREQQGREAIKQKEQWLRDYVAKERADEQQRLEREERLKHPATPWLDPPLAPPLTRDDQARIFNGLIELIKQYRAVEQDSSLTGLQRGAALGEIETKFNQATVPSNAHVIWSCLLKNAVQARTEFGQPHQMDPKRHTRYAAICTYGGFSFTLYLAELDAVLAKSKPGTDLTFDGYAISASWRDEMSCLSGSTSFPFTNGCLPGMPAEFLVGPGGIHETKSEQ